MKNTPFRLFAAALALLSLGFSSCQVSDMDSAAPVGEEVTVTAILPSAVHSKSGGTGDGTLANRCILEVYENGTFTGNRTEVRIEDMKASFTTTLVSGKSYDLVFWADCAEEGTDGTFKDKRYNTGDGLTRISLISEGYLNNDDTADAFFGMLSTDFSGGGGVETTLRRPFGQFNLFTGDLDFIPSSVDLSEVTVRVSFSKVFTGFNALTGELNGQQDGTVAASASVSPVSLVVNEGKPTGQVSFDYLFASPEEEQTLVDFTVSFLDAGGNEVCAPFSASNIHIRRNYMTNAKGNLFTKGLGVSVDLNPLFDGELNIEE